jgi:hypothetical protein
MEEDSALMEIAALVTAVLALIVGIADVILHLTGTASRAARSVALVHAFYLGFLFIAIVAFGVIIAREEGALGELRAQADERLQITRQAAKLLKDHHDWSKDNCVGLILGGFAFMEKWKLGGAVTSEAAKAIVERTARFTPPPDHPPPETKEEAVCIADAITMKNILYSLSVD